MGLTARFLGDQIDGTLEFSGLREKVDHRLRTLSTGQKMRLGFAISTSVQHDIIMMDEWVGAGDADFMRKAKERMQSRLGGSKIVVLASHSTGLLRDICNRSEEHTSELQSLMRTSYAVFCLKKKKQTHNK